MKISKLLPIALAFAMTTTGVFAATEATNSSQQAEYQLNLAEFFDIETVQAPTASNVSYSGNYTAASIDSALVGKFQVISNTNTKDVYLHGTCAAGGEQKALYGTADALKLVFTNTTSDHASTAEAVANITGGSASTYNNPNAIAFNLGITTAHEEGPTKALVSKDFENQVMHYVIENGKATFTCTVQGAAEANTFSTMDTNGVYKATLTMTNAASL